MVRFFELVQQYNKLIDEKEEIKNEMKNNQSTLIMNLLEVKLNETNNKLKTYEEGKFYTQKEYDSNVVYKRAEPTGWENADMKNPSNW